MDFTGFPQHKLFIKPGVPIVLLHNLLISHGLCNGTRILVENVTARAIHRQILTGPFKDNEVLIPKITLFNEEETLVKVSFYRYQFQIVLGILMAVNKCQCPSMNSVSLVLNLEVFDHGKLYVGLSQVML